MRSMVGQLGRVLELIGWFQAEIFVTATTYFIPDFVSDIIYSHFPPAEGRLGCLGLHILAPLSVERVVAHGTGQRPASGGQRRTTPPVEASVRPVAPRVCPVHWNVLRFRQLQRDTLRFFGSFLSGNPSSPCMFSPIHSASLVGRYWSTVTGWCFQYSYSSHTVVHG